MSRVETINLKLVREVQVPAKIGSHEEFAQTILRLWRFMRDGVPSQKEEFAFLSSMYYLLGWLVGDAGKGRVLASGTQSGYATGSPRGIQRT